MFFTMNRMAKQFLWTARNTLLPLLGSHPILKILIVCLVLATSNVAHAQLYGGYGAWGNNVMSHYGGYGNRVMNYYGRPYTPYNYWNNNGRRYYRSNFNRRRF